MEVKINGGWRQPRLLCGNKLLKRVSSPFYKDLSSLRAFDGQMKKAKQLELPRGYLKMKFKVRVIDSVWDTSRFRKLNWGGKK